MNLKFDLQFFGSSGGSQRIQKREPQPEELTTLAKGLYDKIYPSLETFNANSIGKAQDISNNAIQQQSNLLSQVPSSINRSNDIINKMLNVTETGEIPLGLANNMNSIVNKELKDSMGGMLNGLAGRGVLNSSITGQGISRLGQQAADAYNKNYLTVYNAVLSGYGSALQGAQNNTSQLSGLINSLGSVPSTAYDNAYAGLMPAFNFWKTWQSLENSKPEEYDTVVQQGGSCITADTIVTLSNGTKIPVSELHEDDEIQAWDFENGCIASAPLTAFFKRKEANGADIIRVKFEDGSNVGVILEHLFFDITLGKFVAINSDSQEFVGHEFAKVNDDGEVIPVRVKAIYKDGKATETYAPHPVGYWNFLANGFISGNDGQLGFCNRFEFDTEKMRYKPEERAKDLEKYGTFDYDCLKEIMSKEFFYKNHVEEASVAIGKGLITKEYFKSYLEHFSYCFLNNKDGE